VPAGGRVGNFIWACGAIIFKFTGWLYGKSAGQIEESPICPLCKFSLKNQLVKLIGSSSSSVTNAAI
jgi:hypothetical protein